MGKQKKNKGGTGDEYFDYKYGVGEAKHLMKRYDVEGAASYAPDGRSMGKIGLRSDEDVKKDIASKMMNDYDTRRTMEAAAMAGNKNAKKYAKNGIKGKNIQDAYGVMRDLKKEYVGGGGMDGAENRASLTYAAVKADRKNFIADNDAKYALKSELAEMEQEDDPGQARQATEGMSFNDYMKGTFGSKYEEIARGPSPFNTATDGDQDGGTAIPSTSETTSGETAAAAAAQSNLADTVSALSNVGAAAANKSKMGMYALGSLTGGV